MGNKKIRIINILKEVFFYLLVELAIGLLVGIFYTEIPLIVKKHNGTLSEEDKKFIEMRREYWD